MAWNYQHRKRRTDCSLSHHFYQWSVADIMVLNQLVLVCFYCNVLSPGYTHRYLRVQNRKKMARILPLLRHNTNKNPHHRPSTICLLASMSDYFVSEPVVVVVVRWQRTCLTTPNWTRLDTTPSCRQQTCSWQTSGCSAVRTSNGPLTLWRDTMQSHARYVCADSAACKSCFFF